MDEALAILFYDLFEAVVEEKNLLLTTIMVTLDCCDDHIKFLIRVDQLSDSIFCSLSSFECKRMKEVGGMLELHREEDSCYISLRTPNHGKGGNV